MVKFFFWQLNITLIRITIYVYNGYIDSTSLLPTAYMRELSKAGSHYLFSADDIRNSMTAGNSTSVWWFRNFELTPDVELRNF